MTSKTRHTKALPCVFPKPIKCRARSPRLVKPIKSLTSSSFIVLFMFTRSHLNEVIRKSYIFGLLIFEPVLFFSFSQLSFADIYFFAFFNSYLGGGKPEVPEVLKGLPRLTALYEKVRNEPKIKEWMDKRPETSL